MDSWLALEKVGKVAKAEANSYQHDGFKHSVG